MTSTLYIGQDGMSALLSHLRAYSRDRVANPPQTHDKKADLLCHGSRIFISRVLDNIELELFKEKELDSHFMEALINSTVEEQLQEIGVEVFKLMGFGLKPVSKTDQDDYNGFNNKLSDTSKSLRKHLLLMSKNIFAEFSYNNCHITGVNADVVSGAFYNNFRQNLLEMANSLKGMEPLHKLLKGAHMYFFTPSSNLTQSLPVKDINEFISDLRIDYEDRRAASLILSSVLINSLQPQDIVLSNASNGGAWQFRYLLESEKIDELITSLVSIEDEARSLVCRAAREEAKIDGIEGDITAKVFHLQYETAANAKKLLAGIFKDTLGKDNLKWGDIDSYLSQFERTNPLGHASHEVARNVAWRMFLEAAENPRAESRQASVKEFAPETTGNYLKH